MTPTDRLVKAYGRQLGLFRQVYSGAPPSEKGGLFEMYKAVPNKDRCLMRHILGKSHPDCPEYLVDVAQAIARLHKDITFDELDACLSEQGWKRSGLLYPLVVAARYMPTLNDWLPVGLASCQQLESHKHASLAGFEEVLRQANSADSVKAIEPHLEAFTNSMDWDTPAGLAIAGTLDRLAILMRVRSNSGTDLDRDLKAFPSLGDWIDVWKHAKPALEQHLPPSALCPRLHGCRRATWGHASLSLAYRDHGLFIQQTTLEWVQPHADAEPIDPGPPGALSKQGGLHATGARIRSAPHLCFSCVCMLRLTPFACASAT